MTQSASNWVPFGKFNLPLAQGQEKFDASRFADSLAEGVLNRLVRAQVIKGATTREKGKLDLPDPDRECVADGSQRPGAGGNGQPRERDAEGADGHLRFAAEEPDDSGRRGSRQGVGAEEGDQADGARPERAVIRG